MRKCCSSAMSTFSRAVSHQPFADDPQGSARMPCGFVFDHREDYEPTFVHSNHNNLWDLRDRLERRVRRRPYRPWRGCASNSNFIQFRHSSTRIWPDPLALGRHYYPIARHIWNWDSPLILGQSAHRL
jgi:hypothetical protein